MSDEIPRLSPSIAHKLTTESPLHAWAAHRLLGNFRKPPTDSQIQGRMWHAAVLEGGKDIVVVDCDNFKSKEAKEKRDEIRAAGKIAVAAPKFSYLAPASARIRQELRRFGIVFDGEVEQRFEWTEYTERGEPVECSGVIDHWNDTLVHDIKTGSAAVSEREAQRLIAGSHALLQDPAYRNARHARDGIDPERIEVVFAFTQTEEPHAITPVTLAGDFRELARMRWRRAIETWHHCLSQGTDRKFWPGPVEVVTPISAPGWMISHEIELEAMRDE